MNWLDAKYAMLLSCKLDKFKKIGRNYNFRCPFCGDSEKSKSKARGWLYSSNKEHKTRYFCHNCGASMNIDWFIKQIDYNIYIEYIKEKLFDLRGNEPDPVHVFADKMKVPEFVKNTALSRIKKVSQLDPSHPAKLYISSRKIPTEYHHKIFYAPKFKKWVNSIIPDKFEHLDKDEPRLIFPFLDYNKHLFGFQGRSFIKNDPAKYITIMLDDTKPKLFGLDTIDRNKRLYVLEGPIDSMFIKNSIASAGGRLDTNLSFTYMSKDDITIIYDNEPRNLHTIQKIEFSINAGYSVVIWPPNILEKDVNDMILSDIDAMSLIEDNIYTGLEALAMLSHWRKI